jgi:hypothetical protein
MLCHEDVARIRQHQHHTPSSIYCQDCPPGIGSAMDSGRGSGGSGSSSSGSGGEGGSNSGSWYGSGTIMP